MTNVHLPTHYLHWFGLSVWALGPQALTRTGALEGKELYLLLRN